MQQRISEYLNCRKLPTGRRIFTMKAIRRIADDLGDAGIAARCDRSIATDEKTLRVEMDYRYGKIFKSNARGHSTEVDRQIGAVWNAIQAIAQGHTVGEDAVASLATDFVNEVFPHGLAALVQTSFEDRLAEMDILLKRFDMGTPGDLAAHVDALGIRRQVEQLNTLMPKFRAELEKGKVSKVTFAEVKKTQRESFDIFAAAIFAVLATYDTNSAQDVSQREIYLAEFHRQTTNHAAAYRRGHGGLDIDPRTGEAIIEENLVAQERNTRAVTPAISIDTPEPAIQLMN